MMETALESALRRDRVIVAVALAALSALAWTYIAWLGLRMSMPVGYMHLPPHPWTIGEFALMFVMWAVMMVGMMTPSVAPMVLVYARVGRQAQVQGKPLAATGFFVGGYLSAWTVFSLLATSAQWALHDALLLTPMMASANVALSGGVLIAAGMFQWMPVKDACLRNCQMPLAFIQRHGGFPREPLGSLRIGFRHGLYCVGCCWALMALLFIGGVMNLLWIAVISIFVLLEKLLPSSRWFPRAAGTVLCAWGIGLLLTRQLCI